MGARLAIAFEKHANDILVADSTRFQSQPIARRIAELDGICNKLSIPPFGSFVCATSEQINEISEEIEELPENGPPKEEFYQSNEGLIAVQKVISVLMRKDDVQAKDSLLLNDLFALESLLHEAVNQHVDFHFYFD